MLAIERKLVAELSECVLEAMFDLISGHDETIRLSDVGLGMERHTQRVLLTFYRAYHSRIGHGQAPEVETAFQMPAYMDRVDIRGHSSGWIGSVLTSNSTARITRVMGFD